VLVRSARLTYRVLKSVAAAGRAKHSQFAHTIDSSTLPRSPQFLAPELMREAFDRLVAGQPETLDRDQRDTAAHALDFHAVAGRQVFDPGFEKCLHPMFPIRS
jgi:hypothetical protein